MTHQELILAVCDSKELTTEEINDIMQVVYLLNHSATHRNLLIGLHYDLLTLYATAAAQKSSSIIDEFCKRVEAMLDELMPELANARNEKIQLAEYLAKVRKDNSTIQ